MEGWKRGGGKGVGEALARLVKKLLQQEQTLEVMHSLIQRLVLESENRISTLPPTVRPSLPPSLPPSLASGGIVEELGHWSGFHGGGLEPELLRLVEDSDEILIFDSEFATEDQSVPNKKGGKLSK
jgi:hypothetical protein